MTNQTIEEIKELAGFAKSILPVEAFNPNILDAIRVKRYMKALIAANELLQQVVVLEEGAEPMVGDIIEVDFENGQYLATMDIDVWGNIKHRIVSRGGKPVIYQQGAK